MNEQAVESRVPWRDLSYHVMCRGNARQQIFHDETGYQRLVDGLGVTVNRYGWELFSFVLMPNHFHLFFASSAESVGELWLGKVTEVV
jgi:putative transposase